MKKFFVILAAATIALAGCKKEVTPMISISHNELTFDGEATSLSIQLVSNSLWSVSNTTDWITVSPMNGNGDSAISLTVLDNNGMPRTGDIIFSVVGSAVKLTVTQDGTPTISVDPISLSFTPEGGSKTVSVGANKDWSVSGVPDWIKVTPASGSGSAASQTLTVSVESNEDVDRAGVFTVSISGKSLNVNVEQAGTAFKYGGETYQTVVLKDGRTWMASPLKYIPEGKTPSSDPNDGNGIWYPYSSDGKTVTPITENPQGYLYDYPTAFGAEISADNYKSFEGTRGICPEGWHIPTRAELLTLVGYSTKAVGEDSDIDDNTAAYYDQEYQGGRIKTMEEAGFVWSFLGTVIKGNPTAKGSYNALTCVESGCSVPDYLGRNRLTYIMGSTAYNASTTNGNIQFFGMMSTFTNKYPEGRLSLGYDNFLSGYEVRCIKDAQ